MNKLINYLPFHFLIGLISGILIQDYTKFWRFGFSSLLFVVLLLLLLLFFLERKKTKIYFALVSFITFVFLGIMTLYLNSPKNSRIYYAKQTGTKKSGVFEIKRVLRSSKYSDKYEAEVIQMGDKKTTGKVLLNIIKDTLNRSSLKVGQQILLNPEFKEISKAKNPHSFNYANYLSKKGIYEQVFTTTNKYRLLKNSKLSIFAFAQNIRVVIEKSLKKHSFSEEVLSVIKALFLGNRDGITKELREYYINAGVIHILAISGLHIGILTYILTFVFKPIKRLKYGIVIKQILIVLLLWLFAFVAGLSASVVRAVTMFSFITVGRAFSKRTYVEHSLTTSMLLLLLVKPSFLFDVGFQLSYLAVFGIVWMQPLLFKLWKPSYVVVRYFWTLITVSVSAQIAVLPVSLYYFHQFPALFLLSNIVVIPALTVILSFGILIIVISLLSLPLPFLFSLFGLIIKGLNNFVRFISAFEQFIFKDISMSFWQLIAWYLIIIFTYRVVKKQKPQRVIYLLVCIVLLQITYFIPIYLANKKDEFIVFHQSKKTIIGMRKGKHFQVFSNSKNQDPISNYKVGELISSQKKQELKNVFKYKSTVFLLVDSLGIYQIPQLKNPVVILRQSPKINLERLIYVLNPKQIVADGSNYKSYINYWEKTCLKNKTPFYSTYKNGAFIYLSD